MIKKLILNVVWAVLVSLSLSACDLLTPGYEVMGYVEQCKEHGGLTYIDNLVNSARCVDGMQIWSWDGEDKHD